MRRMIIEGFSPESDKEALSDALHKAAEHFSEQHDVSIILLELMTLPSGMHRAMIEVRINNMTSKDRVHPAGADLELKHIHEHEYKAKKKLEENQIKHLVYDHFAARAGRPAVLPEMMMINVGEAKLLHYMIEKEFFKAGHPFESVPFEIELDKPQQILVRTHAPGLKDDIE